MAKTHKYISPPTSPANCDPTDDSEYVRKDGRRRCIAHPKDLQGDRCRHYAVQGHTTCAAHGGTSPKSISQDSRYNTALTQGTLAEAYRRHLNNDDFKSVRDELALVRAFTEAAMAKLDGTNLKDLSPAATGIVLAMITEVRELVEASSRIDQKLSISLTVTDMYGIVGQIFDIVRQFVSDPTVLSKIGEGLENLAMGPGGGPSALPRSAGRLLVPADDPEEYLRKQAEEPV